MSTSNPSAPYFAQVADQWDTLRSGYFTEELRAVALAKAYLHPNFTVADVGSGTGFIAAGLAPLVKHVHVIDGSPAMLTVARQNLTAFSNVEFHTADGLSLPLEDHSVDAVFANMYLHHCPDPLAALREMARVLRPGGRLVLTDLDAHTHEWMKAEMADVWLGFERAQVQTWLAEVGLVNTIVDCTDQNCQAEHATGATAINIFVAVGTKRITAREAVQASYAARALMPTALVNAVGNAMNLTSGGGCGCGEGVCCAPGATSLESLNTNVNWDGGYTAAEKNSIPAEAAEISLGCGNPTAMANLRPGERVLDIGSGGGIDAFLAAQRVGSTGAVIGVDMTPAMLQRARATAEKSGLTNVKFKHGFAEKLPLPDGEVDVVISNCVINLTEDKGQVFREAYRVLAEGGRLEVNDMVFGGAVAPEVRASVLGWSECVSGALPEAEYVDLVKQAGFREVNVRRSTSTGSSVGTPVYSVQVSARKMAQTTEK